ncbi:MAG: hypothetical protein ABIH23_28635 [bacterium]
MKIPRSRFLGALGSTALAAMVNPTALFAGLAIRKRGYVMVKDLNISTFSPHLNTRFRVRRDPMDVIDTELIEVSDKSDKWSSKSEGVELECFSLVFRGPCDPVLPQSTYEITHDGIGTFDMFLVPFERDEKGIKYEAIFNRIREKSE